MSSLRVLVVVVASAGCQGSPKQPLSAKPSPPAASGEQAVANRSAPDAPPAVPSTCLPEPDGDASDLDGDGTADRVVSGYRDVTVYLRRGDCFQLLDKLDVQGRLAFVNVLESSHAGMRDLSIETWLYHGDRQRALWTWDGRTYESLGRPELVPGPGRPGGSR